MSTAAASQGLRDALEITEQMLAAASHGKWSVVADLDAQRQSFMRENVTPQPRDQADLGLLLKKNDALVRTAAIAFAAVEHELGQHNYNHRALNAYMSSSD